MLKKASANLSARHACSAEPLVKKINLKSMEIETAPDFTFITLLYGVMMTVVGVCYNFFPPKKISWSYGVLIKAALRNNDTFREAAKYVSIPMIQIGICWILISFLPFIFHHANVFQWTPGIMLTTMSSLILLIKTQDYLRKIFDENGHRKDSL